MPLVATQSDYLALLASIEATEPLNYMLMDYFYSPDIPLYTTHSQIDDLGITLTGDPLYEKRYVVAEASITLHVREIPQTKGGIRYTIDQWENPETIIFQPGGVFENRWLMEGNIGTASSHPASIALYNRFARAIRKQFTKIDYAWLGKEALQLFHAGMPCSTYADMLPGYWLRDRQAKTHLSYSDESRPAG